ncbi:MAG: hypothetical protein IT429_00320 [Gemmataceae bacterium]|nr:hypothetical protein [Gemmataceae bacterium]
MRRFLPLGGMFILGLALLVPSFAVAQKDEKKDKKKDKDAPVAGKKIGEPGDEKKDDKKDDKKDEKTERFEWSRLKSYEGTLTQLDLGSKRDFILQVKVPEPNPDGYQRLSQLQNTYRQQYSQLTQNQLRLQRTRPQDRPNLLNQIQNSQNSLQRTLADIAKAKQNLVRYKNADMQLRATDTARVRVLQPPAEYDDKGNVKKHTAKELQELRGKDGLPGYKAEFETVRQGQTVRIWLAAPPKGVAAKGAPIRGKKIEDDDLAAQDRPEVLMIMILSEPTR